MDRHNGTRRHPPANGNGPTPEQYDTANTLAGGIRLDINGGGAVLNVPADLVRESLFFSLIPNLMDDSCGEWSAKKLAEAVRRAAETWADLRGVDRLRRKQG